MTQHGDDFGDEQAQRIQIKVDSGSGGTGLGKLQEWTSGFGTLLVEYTLPNPCAPTVVAGTKKIILNPVTPVDAIASGTSASFKLLNSAGALVCKGDNEIGVVGSNCPVIKTTTTVISGAVQSIVSAKFGYS